MRGLPIKDSRERQNNGQALLVILLIMAVVLTIGLSVASRSATDIKISQQTEEAARAFSAAEAGIESALVGTGTSFTATFLETGASYEANSLGFGSGTQFVFPGEYGSDETLTLWLADHLTYAKTYDGNKLRVVWGMPNKPIDQVSPALEISIYYKDGSNYKVGRFALDPVSSATRGHDNKFCRSTGDNCQNIESFTITTETVGGKDFHFGATLNLAGAGLQGGSKILLFARLRMLYSTEDQILGAAAAGSGGNFPAQGLKITSVGQAGTATRKVEVSRLFPAPPSIFDFVLYSGGSLVK